MDNNIIISKAQNQLLSENERVTRDYQGVGLHSDYTDNKEELINSHLIID